MNTSLRKKKTRLLVPQQILDCPDYLLKTFEVVFTVKKWIELQRNEEKIDFF